MKTLRGFCQHRKEKKFSEGKSPRRKREIEGDIRNPGRKRTHQKKSGEGFARIKRKGGKMSQIRYMRVDKKRGNRESRYLYNRERMYV